MIPELSMMAGSTFKSSREEDEAKKLHGNKSG